MVRLVLLLIIITVLSDPYAVVATITGDVNNDGIVDGNDVKELAPALFSATPTTPSVNQYPDSKINLFDLSMVVKNYSPLSTRVYFTAAGDISSNTNSVAVMKELKKHIDLNQNEFFLALGDLSYRDPNEEWKWCDLVKANVGDTFPYELVAGNHEAYDLPNGDILDFIKCLPHRIGNISGRYGVQYYFDYPDTEKPLMRVIMISPNHRIGATSPGTGERYIYEPGSTYYNWVVSAIDTARAKQIPWIITGMHYPCISIGHGSDCDSDHNQTAPPLFNLLVEKKVDLILQGHRHLYERSKQLKHSANCPVVRAGVYYPNCISDSGTDNLYSKGNGPVVAIIGTAGGTMSGIYPDSDTDTPYFVKWMGTTTLNNSGGKMGRYGFAHFTVTADELYMEYKSPTTGTNYFTDSFRIVKL